MAKKTLLLVGRTGSGKSTLANILINKEGNFKEEGRFEETFKEGKYSVSQTKDFQVEKFELEGKKYQIINTVGIGDMKMESSKVLSIIINGCRAAKKGLNQVLFVGCEKFTKEEVEAYNILVELFGKEITKYTTIIRTKFPNFENEDECKKDIELLLSENNSNETVAEMIESCEGRIIHIDNPSISIGGDSSRVRRQISLNKEIREESRKIMLKHLESWQETYRPKSLDEINKRIEEHVEKEGERLRGELKIIMERLEKLERGENLGEEKSLEMLKEQMKVIKELIEENKKLTDKGLFEAVGRGLDKLVNNSLSAVIEVSKLLNKCPIS